MPTMTEQLSHFNDADFMDARSLSTDRPSEDNRSSSEITDDTAHIFPGREYNIGKLRQTESRPSTSIIRVSMEDITPNTDSIVIIRRDLKSWQIFFIVIGGTVGLGIFSDTGKVLSLAGPAGGLLTFLMVGGIVIIVMNAINEMVEYWPISNALVEFITTFVDEDLGSIMGFAYWYSYSITFATMISAAGDLASYYSLPMAVHVLLFNALIPLLLIAINYMGVSWYGNIESLLGGMKILLFIGMWLLMLVVNLGAGGSPFIGHRYIDDGFCNDSSMAPNPAVAMLIAIPMIVYAFCGVEIVAVTALEAKTPEKSLRSTLTRYFTPMLTVVYIVTALLSYLDVSWKDPLLVSLPRKACNPESLIIIVAKNAKIPILPGFLNGCLILAVLSAANTSLYVASRTLFGLTRGLKKSNRTKFENLVCCLGTTNSRGVPVYALAFSVTICGIWLPVVHFEQGYNDQPLQEILRGMATVPIVLMWGIQCIAFIRFRKWLITFRGEITGEEPEFPEFRKSLPKKFDGTFLTWWTNLAIFRTWFAFVFCILTVAVFFSASWSRRGESIVNILIAWSMPVFLVVVWIFTKLVRRRGFVHLSRDYVEFRREMLRLRDMVRGQGGSGESTKETSRMGTFERETERQPLLNQVEQAAI